MAPLELPIRAWLTTWRFRLSRDIQVERGVWIWPGVTVGKGTRIQGPSEVGRPSIRERGRRREKTTIGKNVRILSNSVVYSGVAVGDNSTIGHFTTVREGARFGSSTYIKANTYVGVDVKADSGATLAGLVGDRSTIQADATSLGALVHTSRGPHRGEIESGPILEGGSFVGRSSTIVGEVTVGANAVVAAGTTVIGDVPAKALVRGTLGRITGLGGSMETELIIEEQRLSRATGQEKLHAQLRSVRTSDRPLLVFVHGFSVDGLESHRMFLRFARKANRRGYSTVLFDQYGIGYSDGDYVDYRLSDAANDLAAVVEQSISRTANSGGCVLVGQSLGTACVALTEERLRTVVRGHVLWNISANIKDRYEELFGDGISRDENYVLPTKGLRIGKGFIDDAEAAPIMESFDHYRTPTLILVCGGDEKSDTSIATDAERRIVSAPVSVVRIPGANHSFKGQPELEERAISESLSWIDAIE